MKLSEDLKWRGLIKDTTFGDASWLDEPGRTFYLGTDCSSDSLTIGNLAVLLLARRLIEGGWKAVLLVGGATSLIGDPGGKDEERPLKSREEIERNVAAIRAQVDRLFAGQEFTPADNYDWFKDKLYLDFLRDVGKHYSLTELIQRDFIAARIREGGGGISYAEFSYSLVQGYDFLQLFEKHKVVLQIGGSDQWGNMLSGVSLIRKKANAEAHALSMPLIIDTTTGKKFGKSEAGAVWLDPAKTSVFKFYQFWLNLDDRNIRNYLAYYTLLGQDEIDDIMSKFEADRAGRIAQKILAHEVTNLVHGSEQAEKVQRVTEAIVGSSSIGELKDDELAVLREEMPHAAISDNRAVSDVLVQVGLATSKSEARRLQAGGAVYVNNVPFAKEHFEDGDFHNGRLLLRRGKAYKDSALIELS